MSPLRYLLLATLVLVVGLVSNLPASVAFNWLLPDHVRTSGISGTIWAGSLDAIEIDTLNLGPVEWTAKPLALLTGAVRADIEAALPGGFVEADVAAGPSRTRIRRARGAIELGPVAEIANIGTAGGTARFAIETLDLVDGWPTAATGEVMLDNLTYAMVGSAPLGSYSMTFREADSDDVIADLASDANAPFTLNGQLVLGPERSFSMRADIAAKPGVDASYSRGLAFLGPADANGNRRLEFDGTL